MTSSDTNSSGMMGGREVLDLFSAAAGGWSLGMHRAGYTTIAACEVEAWRRAVYAENNPHVRLYDDVRTLTANRLLADLGRLPRYVVGSPPCQDISSANTKGKGVEGERSGLYFEAIRIIGEVRPRWFALENSANLRTRGADAVIAALEAIGYACWPCVVRAGDIGANHERPRAWLIGCDLAQVTHPDRDREPAPSVNAEVAIVRGLGPDRQSAAQHASGFGHEGGRAWGHGADGLCAPPASESDAADANLQSEWRPEQSRPEGERRCLSRTATAAGDCCGSSGPGPLQGRHGGVGKDADAAGKRLQGQSGRDEPGKGEVAECANVPSGREVGLRAPDRGSADRSGPEWSLAHLTDHLRLDDGLSAWLAGKRVQIGDGKGQSAASLVVEAFGDAVIPQIPEAIGHAIARTETALAAIYGRAA